MGALKSITILVAALATSVAQADPVDRWQPIIAEASLRFGIPTPWIVRVIRAESGGNTLLNGRPTVSRAGALGLMQLMPATWNEMRTGLTLGLDPHDPHDNIIAGTAYLRAMYDRFGYPGLFAAYNAGPGRYAAHLRGAGTLPGETRAYLAEVSGDRNAVANGKGAGAAAAHLRYLQRDGTTRDGEAGKLYGRDSDVIDSAAFRGRGSGDRHQFRFIVSAEDGADYDDLKPLTRRLMERVEEDLGTRLDWVAVDHFNTGHPHSHIIVRGVDERGQDLIIARDYLTGGFRERAAELVDLDLGPRSAREIEQALRGEVTQERLGAPLAKPRRATTLPETPPSTMPIAGPLPDGATLTGALAVPLSRWSWSAETDFAPSFLSARIAEASDWPDGVASRA